MTLSLAGRIAALEDEQDFLPVLDDVLLEFHEFDLSPVEGQLVIPVIVFRCAAHPRRLQSKRERLLAESAPDLTDCGGRK